MLSSVPAFNSPGQGRSNGLFQRLWCLVVHLNCTCVTAVGFRECHTVHYVISVVQCNFSICDPVIQGLDPRVCFMKLSTTILLNAN
jgi:hypothetical protein